MRGATGPGKEAAHNMMECAETHTVPSLPKQFNQASISCFIIIRS
jgi:hypothetical protein